VIYGYYLFWSEEYDKFVLIVSLSWLCFSLENPPDFPPARPHLTWGRQHIGAFVINSRNVSGNKVPNCNAHRVGFLFLSLARFNHVNAELSVYSSKRRESRNGLNLSIAQIIPKHSRSTTPYRRWVSLSFLLAYAIIFLSTRLSPCWNIIAPTPISDASVCKVNGFEKSGEHNFGELYSLCLISSKASC